MSSTSSTASCTPRCRACSSRPSSNDAGASRTQLIFTTHDTHLMDLDLLRRHEIWFLEKDQWGASVLYPMTEIKVRTDLKIEKGYLQGRFGAVPLIQAPAAGRSKAC